MAINENFLRFVIDLAVDEDFKAAFDENPEKLMSQFSLSAEDKKALRSDRSAPVRLQVENVQSSGNIVPKDYKGGGKRAKKR
jgi:hypothetical protein